MDANARLLRAVQRATRTLASSGDINSLLYEMLRISVEAVGASNGTIYLHDPDSQRLLFRHIYPPEIRDRLPVLDIPDNYGVAGLAFGSRHSIRNLYPEKTLAEWNDFERKTGVPLRTILATPLSMEDEEPLGVVQLINKEGGPFSDTDVTMMDTLSAVAAMAIVNQRLLEQGSRASSLLGMGKVSHDIGNLAASLYATLSFGDMAMAGLRGHLLKGKPDRTVRMYVEALDPIFSELKEAVDRLVGYSRLISDLSAGRTLRPTYRQGSMAEAVHQGASYFEDEGRSKLIDLRYEVQYDAPETWFDDTFVARIVQNLVANAIKAVRETYPGELPAMIDVDQDGVPDNAIGRVTVRYAFENGRHRIEVEDTGPGMTEEQVRRALAGDARSEWAKAGGSGWGLRIVRELTSALGGKVAIRSAPGQGATFTVELPEQRVETAEPDLALAA